MATRNTGSLELLRHNFGNLSYFRTVIVNSEDSFLFALLILYLEWEEACEEEEDDCDEHDNDLAP